MNKKLQCCCLLCKNELTTNNLPVHYNSKQCNSGKLFSQTRIGDRDLKCVFCDFVGKNKNSIAQHELYCELNPKRKEKISSYGMKGKKGTNQWIKADVLGLPKPNMSEETREKIRAGNKNNPHAYFSKQSIDTFNELLSRLHGVDYGRVQYASNGKEFWLRTNEDKFFLYDFCFRDLNIIIEFQGIAFHPKNLIEDFRVPYKDMGTKEEIWDKDRTKEKLAIDSGYMVEYIWSDNIEEDLNRIVKIVKSMI